MEARLELAVRNLEVAIAAEAAANQTNWQERYDEKQRAIRECQRIVSKASAMDRLTARRTIAAILTSDIATAVLAAQ